MPKEKEFFSPEVYRTIFKIESPEDIEFIEDMLKAVAAIDGALVPRMWTHPYAQYIKMGADGIPPLLDRLHSPVEGTTSADVLDALAFIFINMPRAPEKALAKIRPLLNDPQLSAEASRVLAIGRDEYFLRDMMNGLASDDPGEVAASALLMGYGRFEPAVETLISLVSPLRFFESRPVIWALGEIGSREAIPVLTLALSENFRPIDSMMALAKIGDLTAVSYLTPHIIRGERELRETALRALSILLEKNEDTPQALAELKPVLLEPLKKLALEDESKTARFYALLSIARLGEKMPQSQIKKALQFAVSEDDLSSIQKFFLRKRGGH